MSGTTSADRQTTTNTDSATNMDRRHDAFAHENAVSASTASATAGAPNTSSNATADASPSDAAGSTATPHRISAAQRHHSAEDEQVERELALLKDLDVILEDGPVTGDAHDDHHKWQQHHEHQPASAAGNYSMNSNSNSGASASSATNSTTTTTSSTAASYHGGQGQQQQQQQQQQQRPQYQQQPLLHPPPHPPQRPFQHDSHGHHHNAHQGQSQHHNEQQMQSRLSLWHEHLSLASKATAPKPTKATIRVPLAAARIITSHDSLLQKFQHLTHITYITCCSDLDSCDNLAELLVRGTKDNVQHARDTLQRLAESVKHDHIPSALTPASVPLLATPSPGLGGRSSSSSSLHHAGASGGATGSSGKATSGGSRTGASGGGGNNSNNNNNNNNNNNSSSSSSSNAGLSSAGLSASTSLPALHEEVAASASPSQSRSHSGSRHGSVSAGFARPSSTHGYHSCQQQQQQQQHKQQQGSASTTATRQAQQAQTQMHSQSAPYSGIPSRRDSSGSSHSASAAAAARYAAAQLGASASTNASAAQTAHASPHVSHRTSPRGAPRALGQPSPPHTLAYVFVDNSNIFIGAQLEGSVRDLAVRVNIRSLCEIIEDNMPCAFRAVAGTNPNSGRIWHEWENNHYRTLLDRSDASMHNVIASKLEEVGLTGANPQLLVLATGDGNEMEGNESFPRLAERAIQQGWLVRVWSWEQSLSGKFRDLKERFGTQVSIHFLDPYKERITFKAGQGQRNASTSSLTSGSVGAGGAMAPAGMGMHGGSRHQHQHHHHHHHHGQGGSSSLPASRMSPKLSHRQGDMDTDAYGRSTRRNRLGNFAPANGGQSGMGSMGQHAMQQPQHKQQPQDYGAQPYRQPPQGQQQPRPMPMQPTDMGGYDSMLAFELGQGMRDGFGPQPPFGMPPQGPHMGQPGAPPQRFPFMPPAQHQPSFPPMLGRPPPPPPQQQQQQQSQDVDAGQQHTSAMQGGSDHPGSHASSRSASLSSNYGGRSRLASAPGSIQAQRDSIAAKYRAGNRADLLRQHAPGAASQSGGHGDGVMHQHQQQHHHHQQQQGQQQGQAGTSSSSQGPSQHASGPSTPLPAASSSAPSSTADGGGAPLMRAKSSQPYLQPIPAAPWANGGFAAGGQQQVMDAQFAGAGSSSLESAFANMAFSSSTMASSQRQPNWRSEGW